MNFSIVLNCKASRFAVLFLLYSILIQIRICRRGGALVRRALVRDGSHLCDAPGFHFVRAVNPHLLRYTCRTAVDILLGKVFLKLSFLNFLLLFRYLGRRPKWRKSIKRFRKGVWGRTLLQKGFPQLSDKYTAVNSYLSAYCIAICCLFFVLIVTVINKTPKRINTPDSIEKTSFIIPSTLST